MITWKGASRFRDRIRRCAVFEKLGYGSSLPISAHGYECTCYVFLGRPNTATVHNARQNSILYTRARARAPTNLPFPSLQPVHTSAAYLGSSSQLFTLPSRKLFYRYLLETLPIASSYARYVFLRGFRENSRENFSLDCSLSWNRKKKKGGLEEKIDGCSVIEIHTDISSRMSYLFVLFFFFSIGMINGIGRKRERKKGFVFVKNLSLEETSSGQTFFVFFFFLFVSFMGGVMPGYLIIFCKMNFSFSLSLFFFLSVIDCDL